MLPSKLLRCFKFWRELCFSNCIWESLVRERWPLLTSFDFPISSSSSSSASTDSHNFKGDDLIEALRACEISDRHVCVKWCKIGKWFHGFRRRDESHSRWISLADLATEDDEHILGVLHRGTIHEVLRVQISAVGHASTPWFHQVTQR